MCDKEKNRAYYLKRKETISFQQREKRKTDEYKKWYKEYCEKNRHKLNSRSSARRAKERNATPSWLSDSQKAHINRTYKLREIISDATGIEYHVDHIEPLNGKNICGLHVPWNLQVIPAKDNLEKGNKR